MPVFERLGIETTITVSATFTLAVGLGAVTQLALRAGTNAAYDAGTSAGQLSPVPDRLRACVMSLEPAPITGFPNRLQITLTAGGTTYTDFSNTGGDQSGGWSVSFAAELVRTGGTLCWMPKWGGAWSTTATLGPAGGTTSGTNTTGSYVSWLPWLQFSGQVSAGTTGGGSATASMLVSDGTTTWTLGAPYSTSRTWSTGSTSSQTGATPTLVLTPGTSGQGFATLLIEQLPDRSCRFFGKVYHGNAPASSRVDLQLVRRNLRGGSIAPATSTLFNPGDNYSIVELQNGVSYSAGHFWSTGAVSSSSGQLSQVATNSYRSVSPRFLDMEPGNVVQTPQLPVQWWNAYQYVLSTSRTWSSRYSPLHWQFGPPAGFDLRTHSYIRVRVRHTTSGSRPVWFVIGDRNSAPPFLEAISAIRVWKVDKTGASMVTDPTANTWTDFELDYLRPDQTFFPDGFGGYTLVEKDIEVDTDGPPGEIVYNGELMYDATPDSGGKWFKVLPSGDLTVSDANLQFGEIEAKATGAAEVRQWGISSAQNVNLVDGRQGLLSYSSWTRTNLAPGTWSAVHSDGFGNSMYPKFPIGGLTGQGSDWGENGMIYLGSGAWRLDWGVTGTTVLLPQQRGLPRLDEWPAGLWDIWSLAAPGAPGGFCLPCSFRGRGALVGVVFDTPGRRSGASVEIAEPPPSGSGPGVSFGVGVTSSLGVFATTTPFGLKKTTSAHTLRFQPTGGGTPNRTYPHTNVIHRGTMSLPSPPSSPSLIEIWSLMSPLTGHFCRAWISDTSGGKVLFVRTGGGIPGETALQPVVTVAPISPGVVYASPTLGVRVRGELVLWYAKQNASGWIIEERVSDDEGDTWSDPVQVVPSGGYMADNPHPRIASATGDGIGGHLYYWFTKTGTSGGADVGKLKGLFVPPGETFDATHATYFKDHTGADLSVAFGATHMVQSHGGQCFWVLTCTIPGETDPSDWRCADESGLTFTRIS